MQHADRALADIDDMAGAALEILAESAPAQKWETSEGRPIFGGGSPHEVGKHLMRLALEGLKHESPSHPRGIGFNEGVDAAIAALQSATAPQAQPEECA